MFRRRGNAFTTAAAFMHVWKLGPSQSSASTMALRSATASRRSGTGSRNCSSVVWPPSMPQSTKGESVSKIKRKGLSNREIAYVLGVDHQTSTMMFVAKIRHPSATSSARKISRSPHRRPKLHAAPSKPSSSIHHGRGADIVETARINCAIHATSASRKSRIATGVVDDAWLIG